MEVLEGGRGTSHKADITSTEFKTYEMKNLNHCN